MVQAEVRQLAEGSLLTAQCLVSLHPEDTCSVNPFSSLDWGTTGFTPTPSQPSISLLRGWPAGESWSYAFQAAHMHAVHTYPLKQAHTKAGRARIGHLGGGWESPGA